MPDDHDSSLKRSVRALKLRHAVQANDFHLVYQPIVDVRHGSTTCLEALLRWRDQTNRDVPPSVFIPLAERLGIMDELGSWVLRQACEDAAAWPSDVAVSVNASASQIDRPDFGHTVQEVLRSSGLAPERLEIEVTETAALADKARAAGTLSSIRTLGVGVALDDFGTCYSSLSMVQRLPLSRVKIDRSFVQPIDGSLRSLGIARGIMEIANAFDLKVTAEGVETRQQAAALRSIGCVTMQGYLFGRPAALDAWRSGLPTRLTA